MRMAGFPVGWCRSGEVVANWLALKMEPVTQAHGHPTGSGWMNSRLKCNSVSKEYLVGGFETEALSGSVVIAFQEARQAGCGKRIEVSFSGQLTAQPTNGVFDTALLPRRMGVAEPSLNAKPSAQQIVHAELASIIEGHGLT